MANTKPRIALTVGDPNGVGYEIILKTLSEAHVDEVCTPIIYGNRKHLQEYQKMLATEECPLKVNCEIIDCYGDVALTPGKGTKEGGAAALACLNRAANALQEGKVDAIVTAPINKDMIQGDGFHFPGHTEYLAEKFGIEGQESLMMLTSDRLRVALVCNHEPIAKLTEVITRERIVAKLEALNRSLTQDFAIRKPRIGVLALNPHAGDNGLIGTEEQTVIRPAIEEAKEKGMAVFGPYSADGFFGAGEYQHFDAVLAMYHDQGLIPFKTLDMNGVNYTAGLSIVRTSPDHGTAYGIAGKNEASAESMRHALWMALDVLKTRKEWAEINSNPLKITVRPRPERPERVFLPFEKKENAEKSE